MTKIYLVTVADQETIDYIDAADKNNEDVFICMGTHHKRIAEITEYVNVDSP